MICSLGTFVDSLVHFNVLTTGVGDLLHFYLQFQNMPFSIDVDEATTLGITARLNTPRRPVDEIFMMSYACEAFRPASMVCSQDGVACFHGFVKQ